MSVVVPVEVVLVVIGTPSPLLSDELDIKFEPWGTSRLPCSVVVAPSVVVVVVCDDKPLAMVVRDWPSSFDVVWS